MTANKMETEKTIVPLPFSTPTKVQGRGLKRELWHWVIDALVILLIIACIVGFFAWMFRDVPPALQPSGLSNTALGLASGFG
jgi:hypothetical protein